MEIGEVVLSQEVLRDFLCCQNGDKSTVIRQIERDGLGGGGGSVYPGGGGHRSGQSDMAMVHNRSEPGDGNAGRGLLSHQPEYGESGDAQDDGGESQGTVVGP